RHRGDKLEHKASGRRAQVNVIPQANKRDAKRLELGQCIYQMLEGPTEPVDFPNQDGVELPLSSIDHQSIERGPRLLGTRRAMVYIYFNDLQAAAFRVFPQLGQLHFGTLAYHR